MNKRVFLVLAFFIAAALCGDPSCNPPKGPPPRTLSFSSSKSQAQRLYNAQKILKLKKQNVLLSEDIQPYIYASDGGDYVSSVEQLPWQYNKEIGIGPSTKDNPEPNYYITDAGLNAMSCQLDCMSKINDTPLFTACNMRFYKYGSLADTQGCFSDVNDARAKLVKDICVKINGCYGATSDFTPSNLERASGSNNFIDPGIDVGGKIGDGQREQMMIINQQ